MNKFLNSTVDPTIVFIMEIVMIFLFLWSLGGFEQTSKHIKKNYPNLSNRKKEEK